FQVQSLIKERENVKLEYQKLFDSIKKTRTQTQWEIDELIENVNQKTYAYADARAQNQDLLITISELKAKLKMLKKETKSVLTSTGLKDATSVRRPSSRGSSSKNSVLLNTKNHSEDVEVHNVLITCHDSCLAKYKLNMHSNVRRDLFTTPRTVTPKSLDTTSVVTKTSVGQFYDGDLEVASRSKTCYVQNLKGDDLLTGAYESNLYIISISDMAASSSICLMSKATSTKS
ncbi:hypothetical protein Tco_1060683, partial [Tanacetum coccineum]